MKMTNLKKLIFSFAFVFLLTLSAAAQSSEPGMGSYTSIDYDEATNTVYAYSETDADYEVMGDYQASVYLTVKNDSGVTVASALATDTYGDGYAAAELSFAGAANTTYTATGIHRGIATLWDYDYDPPYNQIFYFDNWYFTPFEAQNVYNPWQYFFLSPGYRNYTRRTERINLGSTYDSISTVRGSDIIFKDVTNDVNGNVANFDNLPVATVNLSRASHPVCGDNSTPFTIYVYFTLPPDAISIYNVPRTYISRSDRMQFLYLPPAYFNQVDYTNHTATLVIRVRQVDASLPDNGFGIRIEGGKRGGGSYSGSATVNFTCPSIFLK